MIFTAHDAQTSLLNFLGGNNDAQSVVQARQAINAALDNIWGYHNWPYYAGQDVLVTDAPYSTGTITYDSTTKLFTLTGGTWPTWSIYGTIVVGTEYARVIKRVSSTVIQVESVNGFSTITDPTAFVIYRNEYPVTGEMKKISYLLPDRFVCADVMYVPPLEFFTRRPGINAYPTLMTVQKDRNAHTGNVIVLWPYPTAARVYRYSYIRSPNKVTVWSYETGKISSTADSTAVTGNGTTWLSGYAGAILRTSRHSQNLPTNMEGLNPYADEAEIETIGGVAALTTKTAMANTLGNVMYLISSRLDIEPTILWNPLLYKAMAQLAPTRNMDPKATALLSQKADRELSDAQSRASTVEQITYAGNGQSSRSLSYFSVL